MRGNDEAFIYLLLRLSLVCRAKARPTAFIWLGLLSVGIYPDFYVLSMQKNIAAQAGFAA